MGVGSLPFFEVQIGTILCDLIFFWVSTPGLVGLLHVRQVSLAPRIVLGGFFTHGLLTPVRATMAYL
jgi:hypothetical protein